MKEKGVTISNRNTLLRHNRDFLLLWSGQVISSIGTQVSQFAFPLLALAVTHSPAQAGFIGAFRGLPYVIFCLPGGVLVDRWNRKRIMIFCDIGRAIALGTILIALLIGHITVVHLYIVSLIEGTLYTFFSLAEAACLPRVVSNENLPAATAWNQTIYATSDLLGPSLGGILYSIGHLFPFLADTISYVASVVSLSFIKSTFQAERVKEPGKLRVELQEGLMWLWHQPLIRFMALLTGGLYLFNIGYILLVIVLAQGQHASSFTIGFILASAGIGTLVGVLIVNPIQKRFSFGQIIIITVWGMALSWGCYAVAPNPFALGVVTIIGSIIVPIYDVVQYSYRLALIPDQLQGRVNSVFRLIAWGCQPLGLALIGVLIQLIGPIPTVLMFFIAQVLLGIITSLNRHVRNARPIAQLEHMKFRENTFSSHSQE